MGVCECVHKPCPLFSTPHSSSSPPSPNPPSYSPPVTVHPLQLYTYTVARGQHNAQQTPGQHPSTHMPSTLASSATGHNFAACACTGAARMCTTPLSALSLAHSFCLSRRTETAGYLSLRRPLATGILPVESFLWTPPSCAPVQATQAPCTSPPHLR